MSTTEMLKFWSKSTKFGIPTYTCNTQNHPEIEVHTDKFPFQYQFEVNSNIFKYATLDEALDCANTWVKSNWKWININPRMSKIRF